MLHKTEKPSFYQRDVFGSIRETSIIRLMLLSPTFMYPSEEYCLKQIVADSTLSSVLNDWCNVLKWDSVCISDCESSGRALTIFDSIQSFTLS